MRRAVRIVGTLMIGAGVLMLAWAILVWRWQDPFTALYTHWKQHELAGQYKHVLERWQPPTALKRTRNLAGEERLVRREATLFDHSAKQGSAIGRIVIGRLGLNMILVNGTDSSTLTKGPGRDLRTYMPGQDRLVYIAGHRTTYLAPFSHIESIRDGDYIRLEMPYGTFVYRAFRHFVVPASDLAMLHSPDHELLRLQACHPRFFASHRYIVDARLVRVEPRGGAAYTLGAPPTNS
ncbi:MAG TPA: class E sortase [Candidatus Binatia bacterium]|nr:class E sortase [Candidatus Binatia bacterium]